MLTGGRKASAIHLLRKIDHDTYTFEAVAREIDGKPQPNIPETVIVRTSKP